MVHRRKTTWRKVNNVELTTPSARSTRMKEECRAPPSSSCALNIKQIDRLRTVLDDRVEIHGRGNFPTISVRLLDLITCVRRQLRAKQIAPRCVKLNGGAASYVVAADEFAFSDLDLIFPTDLLDEMSFEKVRVAVFDALVELMPDSTNKSRISMETLKDIYIRKMVKVDSDNDRWSLFSLHNDYGKCIELKFVDRMRRQFEFSVDSFQIELDSLLDDFDHPHPKVVVESMFGDIDMALGHLHRRLIDTCKPEEIRGGGLLKYCHLLTRGYRAARPNKCRLLEKYMCSRFFIDFPDAAQQEVKLRNYLDSHFGSISDACSTSGDDTDSEASTSHTPSTTSLSLSQAKYDFLVLLYKVIGESTVCLMSHERRQTLQMIDRLAWELINCVGRSESGGPRQTLLYMPPNASQWIPVV